MKKKETITAAVFGLVCVVCVVAAGMLPLQASASSGTMNIVAIDLGAANSGEATMISDGNGKALLVDSGDNHNRAVFSWLDSNGYKSRQFDTLVTHWHDDHAGNTAEIIRKYKVGTVYIPSDNYLYEVDSSYYKYERKYANDVKSAAKARGTKIVYLKKGNTIKVGDVTGKILYVNGSPKKENWYDVQRINNQSAAIMFSGGGSKLLMTGDVQTQVEKRILKSGVSVKADIYKMSHHGYDRSNTQSFIDEVDPTYAWFTSYRASPSQYVVSDVRDGVTRMNKKANTFSTRYNGTIKYVCKDGEIKVSAGRNTAKMYQKLIDKKNLKSTKKTFTFNKSCEVHITEKIIDGDQYYCRQLDADGNMFSGKRVKIGDYFYLKNGNIPAINTIAKDSGKEYYFDIHGRRKKGFIDAYGKRYYFAPAMATGFKSVDGKKYYFLDSASPSYSNINKGMMMTGFRTIGGKQYYLEDSSYVAYKAANRGRMHSGFFTVNGKRYYAANSAMAGYTTAINGSIQHNWVTVGEKKYYLGSDGVVRTGWQTIGGKKYYMASDGAMSANTFRTVDGKKYYFDADGQMAVGWRTVSSKKYYFEENGVMQTGDKTISGKRYRFDSSGVFVKEINCHLDKNGDPITGWHDIDGKRYYAYEDGELATGHVTIDGAEYLFDTVQNGCALLRSYDEEEDENLENASPEESSNAAADQGDTDNETETSEGPGYEEPEEDAEEPEEEPGINAEEDTEEKQETADISGEAEAVDEKEESNEGVTEEAAPPAVVEDPETADTSDTAESAEDAVTSEEVQEAPAGETEEQSSTAEAASAAETIQPEADE